MTTDIFSDSPKGYARSKVSGWVKPNATPASKTLRKLKEDKDRLEQELAELKATVAELVASKKKK